jgi:pilus assembly protein CpaB
LQNIVVLSAGQTLQPESRGQAINVPVVTLLVTPDQAETLTLAGNEGRIQLILRNGSDQVTTKPPGRETAELYGLRNAKADEPPKAAPVKARPPAARPAPPPPVAAPDEVVIFRGDKRTVEVVGAKKSPGETN